MSSSITLVLIFEAGSPLNLGFKDILSYTVIQVNLVHRLTPCLFLKEKNNNQKTLGAGKRLLSS